MDFRQRSRTTWSTRWSRRTFSRGRITVRGYILGNGFLPRSPLARRSGLDFHEMGGLPEALSAVIGGNIQVS